MLGSPTKLFLQALHLDLQALAVGCCLLLQLLVLLGPFGSQGREKGTNVVTVGSTSRWSLHSEPITCVQAGAPARPDLRAPLAG